MASTSVMTIDIDDITGHLKCSKKTAYQIFGMAEDGKLADYMMEDFWLGIESLKEALEGYSPGAREHYGNIGKEFEQKQEAMKKRSNPSPETIEAIYELAFGEDAIHRDFSEEDLISTLKEYTEQSHLFSKMAEALQEEGWDINKGVSN